MNFEIVEQVPGISDERVAELASEAKAGYELTGRSATSNPHHRQGQLVPTDLLDAIDKRAEQDGSTREIIVRQALTAYLHSA